MSVDMGIKGTIESLHTQLAQAAQTNKMMVEYSKSVMEVAQKYATDADAMRMVIFTLVWYVGGHLAIPINDIVERKFEVTQDDKYLYLDVVEEGSQ